MTQLIGFLIWLAFILIWAVPLLLLITYNHFIHLKKLSKKYLPSWREYEDFWNGYAIQYMKDGNFERMAYSLEKAEGFQNRALEEEKIIKMTFWEFLTKGKLFSFKPKT